MTTYTEGQDFKVSSDPDNYMYYNTLQQTAFDGASQDYMRDRGELPIGDADELAIAELHLLIRRARDVARNSGLAYAAEDNLITKLGSIKVNWLTPDGDQHILMQQLWDEFANNPNQDNRGNFDNTQILWNHDRWQTGNALCRMLIQTKRNNNSIKLKLQNIETEYLDLHYQGADDLELSVLPPNSTRYGITFDNNIPIYYNFFAERYHSRPDYTIQFKHRKIPAEDMLHIFERRRSNQWLGIPIMAPVLINLYKLSDLTEATVNKQTAAAAISWIIEQANAFELNPLGGVNLAGKRNPNDLDKKLVLNVNGGSVQYTNPGDKFHLVQSADIGDNLIGLVKHELQVISSSLGIPYYMLSGDTDSLDFSSIRGILIKLRNTIEFIHSYINLPDGVHKVTQRFKALAALRYAVKDAVATYQFPRNYGVDELKDAQSDLLELQMGATTLERIQKERDVTMEEVLTSRRKMEENGLGDILRKQPEVATQNKNIRANINSTE